MHTMIPFKTYAPLTLLCLASLTIADSAAARAGGGVSVGRASSASVTRSTPSYTAPRPSFTTPRPVPAPVPAPVPRPAPRLETPMIPAAPRPPVPAVAPAAQSSSSNAFLKGLAGGVVGAAVFSALTPNHSTTVVAPAAPAPMVAPMAGAPAGMAPVAAAPAVYQVDNGLPWGSILMTTLLLSGLGAAAYYARKNWLMRREEVAMTHAETEVKHLPEFPLDFFYDVQRAAMNGDIGAMTKLCSSPGLAQALMDKTEDVDVHEIFKGVTWEPRSGDTLAFSFLGDGTPVTELWFFSYGRLDGISVV